MGERDYLQEPFDVYKDYCAVKGHFQSKTYNLVKYKAGLKNVSGASFAKRNDKAFFFYLASVLNKSENIPFFVAQCVESSNFWIGDIAFEKEESMRRYSRWVNRIDKMKENYIIDIRNMSQQGYTWKTLLGYDFPKIPPLFMMATQKKITPETYIMLDKLTGYITMVSERYKEDLLICQLNLKFKKYGLFLDVSTEAITKLTPKRLEDVA